MKRILYILALPLLLFSCKKDVQSVQGSDINATIKAKLIGHWGEAHELVHYIDSLGHAQTFDDYIYNEMIFNSEGAFAKYHGSDHEFTGSFVVKSENGINSFVCTSAATTPVIMTYKINTLTSTTLSVTSSTMPTWSAKKDGVIYSGTNAYYEETYTKQ